MALTALIWVQWTNKYFHLLLGAIRHNLGLSLSWQCMKAILSLCLVSALADAVGPEIGRPEVTSES